ncbi:unnamed protein product [Clonostachys chloroleuca]|uniref:Uncharacterized protein n=1 Tax=Clonostachys chloroleuca TaxID=1926264 RepID=A0AA35VJW2_9HYPO|nr:unnamed protein product [Clonostachys chloroleuca]
MPIAKAEIQGHVEDVLAFIQEKEEGLAKDALYQFKDMITKYQAPEKYEDSITMPAGVRWAQDKRDLESLDDHAIFTATRLISSLIVPNPSPSLKSPPDQKDEIARMAWEFFPKEISGMAKDTWGKIAQEQVKAFTHVLRSMEKK